MKKIYKLTLILVITMGMLGLQGCKEEKLEICGGAIPKYALCMEVGKETCCVMLPIISNKKIENIELVSAVTSADFPVDITGEMCYGECEEYKDKMMYFFQILCKYEEKNPDISMNITGLNLRVDSEEIYYPIDDFYVCSLEYLEKKYEATDSARDLLLGGGIDGLYGTIPTEERPISLNLVSDTLNTVNIKKYMLLNDYITIEGASVGTDSIVPNDINIEREKGNAFVVFYHLNYGEGVKNFNIIRDSQIVLFTDENDENRIFVYGPGIYIYEHFEEYKAIKLYIDQL